MGFRFRFQFDSIACFIPVGASRITVNHGIIAILDAFDTNGQEVLGFIGTLSLLYSTGLPSLLVYTRKMEKSPVCLGHSQLSVSPPDFPTLSGGVPTSLISLYTLYTYIRYWLSLNILYILAVTPFSLSLAFSMISLYTSCNFYTVGPG